MVSNSKNLEKLLRFRSFMNLSVSSEDVRRIWGKKFFKELDPKIKKELQEDRNIYVENKVQITKDNLSKILIFNFVKFVGVSGSVGAGFAKEEDDIDLFIVVKDNAMWLYRGILSLLNLFNGHIRTKRDKSVKDKFCINLISEEHDLVFENDMFNFHELMYLKPIYNEKYISYIYSKNIWLRDDYEVKTDLLKTKITNRAHKFSILKIFNTLAFLLQMLFMLVSKHNPEIGRLIDNSKKGKIEFFPKEYKSKILENYFKRFKSIN